jgi:hypothetical protein
MLLYEEPVGILLPDNMGFMNISESTNEMFCVTTAIFKMLCGEIST